MNPHYDGVPKRYLFISIVFHSLLVFLFLSLGLKDREAQGLVTVYLSQDLTVQDGPKEKTLKPGFGFVKKEDVPGGGGLGVLGEAQTPMERSEEKGLSEPFEKAESHAGEPGPSGTSSYSNGEKDYPYGIAIASLGSGSGHGSGLGGEEKGSGGTIGGGGGQGSGGVGGSGLGQGDGGGHYIKVNFAYIREIVLKNLKYPYIARLRGYEGDVVVSFIIDEKGYPQEIKILSNSGHEILAQNTVETIRSIGRFPEPPVKVRVILPVAYRLK